MIHFVISFSLDASTAAHRQPHPRTTLARKIEAAGGKASLHAYSVSSRGVPGARQRMGYSARNLRDLTQTVTMFDCAAGKNALGGPRAPRVIIQPSRVVCSLHVMLGD